MLERFAVLIIAFSVVGLIIGGAVLYAKWWRKTKGVPTWTRFLEQTGYRRADAPHDPLPTQAAKIMSEMVGAQGISRGPWVRDVEGMTLTYRSQIEMHEKGQTYQESWLLALPFSVGAQIQILERSVVNPSFMTKLGNTALGRSQRWGTLLPHEVQTGDAAFDARFVVRSDQPQRALDLLASQHARQALLSLPVVFLLAAQQWLAYDDPEGVVRKQHVGYAVSPTRLLELEPPMHHHVVHVLTEVARAARAIAAAA